MERTPEPEELMIEADQVAAYARADFTQANILFCTELEKRAGPSLAGRAVDLGCGPADIPVRLARRHPELQIDAIDGSAAMLECAARTVEKTGVASRVRLICRVLSGADEAHGRYDFVLSNSLLHHLRDPSLLWREISPMLRPNAFVQIMDLFRPPSESVARDIVERYSGGEPAVLKRDFLASLLAAFTLEEVRAQVLAENLTWLQVEAVSDRHLLVSGSPAGTSATPLARGQ